MILATDRALEDLGDKVSDSDKKEAEELKEDLKKALEGFDYTNIYKEQERDIILNRNFLVASETNILNSIEENIATKESLSLDDKQTDSPQIDENQNMNNSNDKEKFAKYKENKTLKISEHFP